MLLCFCQRGGDFIIPNDKTVGLETIRHRALVTGNLLPNEMKSSEIVERFKEINHKRLRELKMQVIPRNSPAKKFSIRQQNIHDVCALRAIDQNLEEFTCLHNGPCQTLAKLVKGIYKLDDPISVVFDHFFAIFTKLFQKNQNFRFECKKPHKSV